MANKGLRKENTMLKFELGDIEVSVDLAKDNKNIIAYIPLCLNVGPKPINVGIFYNYLNRDNPDDKFGKGYRFSNYKKLVYQSPFYCANNADGSVEKYRYLEQTSDDITYINDENKSILYIYYDYDYDTYTIYDKHENYIRYPEYDVTNFEIVNMKGEDCYTFQKETAYIKVTNSYNYESKYYFSNNKVTSFEYKENNTTVYTGSITYTSDRITGITITKGLTVVKNYTINYVNGIQITDNITNNVLNLTVEENYEVTPNIIKITVNEGYSTNQITTVIDYSDKKTIVTNHLNQVKTYFFDNDYLLEQIIDEFDNVATCSYDNEIYELKFESKGVYQNKTENNNILSLNDQNFDFFTSSFTNLQQINDSSIESYYQTYLTKMYQNSSSGVIWATKSIDGIAKDSYSLVLWVKKISGTGSFKVDFNLGGVHDIIELAEAELPTNHYKMIYLGNTSYVSYNHIGLHLYVTDSLVLQFGRIEILNYNLKTKYSYNNTNLSEVEDGFSYSNNNYNSLNMVDGSYGNTKNSTLYTYTSSNQVQKEMMPYGIEKNYTYSSNQKTKEELKDGNTLKWEENYNYTNHDLTSFVDKYNKTTSYSYLNHNLVSKTDPLLNVIHYTYDDFDEIETIYQGFNNQLSIDYNSNRTLNEITLPLSSKYKYIYNNKNQIIEVLFKNETLEEYTYYTNNLIETIKRGTDTYKFEYDLKYRIEYIKLNGIVKYKFIYDNKNRITNVQILENNTYQNIKEYTYDKKDNLERLKQLNFKLDYIYHQNKMCYRIYDINDYKVYLEHIGENNLTSKNPLYFENYITSTLNLIGTSFNYGFYLKSFDELVSPTVAVAGNNPKAVLNNIHSINTSGGNAILSYPGGTYQDSSTRCVGIAMWININVVYNNDYLFTIRNDSSPNICKVYCYLYGNTLNLKIVNSNGSARIIMTKEVNFESGKWHFVGFSYHILSIEDDESFVDRFIYRLVIDGNCYENSYTDTNYHIGLTNAKYYIGCNIDTLSERLNGYVTALSISNGREIEKEDFKNYYDFSKAFIIKKDDYDGTINYSSDIEYDKTILSDYDIIPLHSNVLSLKGKKPKCYNYIKSNKFIFDDFNYNNEIKLTAYTPNEKLAYDFEFTNSGTVILDMLYDITKEKCYIIEHVFNNDGLIGLYLNNNKIMLEIKNYSGLDSIIIDSNLTLTKNIWYKIGLTYSYSNGVIYYKIFKDNNVVSGQQSIYQMMTYQYTTIGRSNWYSGIDYQDLEGYIHMIVYKAAFIEYSDYNYVKTNLNYYNQNNYYDKYNHLIKNQIRKNTAQILTTSYSYVKDRITSELINSNMTRSYTYNDNGNITAITDTNFGSHSYDYDSLNRLSSEDNVIYTYDNEGNILSFGNLSFYYDNLKRLNKVGNDDIYYPQTGNKFLPIQYKNYNYYYEGKRLIRVSITESGELIHVNYEYDEKGLLIKKCEIHHYIDDEYEDEYITNYYYDEEDRLITEEYYGNRCDYLYNDNGIYGFIINLTNRYYYIKDITGTILGIVDSTGTIIGKYNYDAYGNITSNTVNIHNSILYKEYLYDFKSKLYYLKSRFYKPKWRRFLTPDSIDYLDIHDLNGVNLFSYCNNNPVMYSDGDGTFANFVFWIVKWLADETIRELNELPNLETSITADGKNVGIKDSYKIYLPWVQYFYCNYINNINYETKDFIIGTNEGLQFEWMRHNIAYHFYGLFGNERKMGQAGSVAFGPTIFDDNHGFPSYVMEVCYFIAHSKQATIDFIIWWIKWRNKK